MLQKSAFSTNVFRWCFALMKNSSWLLSHKFQLLKLNELCSCVKNALRKCYQTSNKIYIFIYEIQHLAVVNRLGLSIVYELSYVKVGVWRLPTLCLKNQNQITFDLFGSFLAILWANYENAVISWSLFESVWATIKKSLKTVKAKLVS